MGVNIIKRSDGKEIFNISFATVTPQTLKSGITAHGADGEPIVGTATPGGPPAEIVAGDQPVLYSGVMGTATSTSSFLTTGAQVRIYVAGTYRFRWLMAYGAKAITFYSRLYVNGVAVGTQQSVTGENVQECTLDYTCKAGDVVTVRVKGGTGITAIGTKYGAAGCLSASILWDIDMT